MVELTVRRLFSDPPLFPGLPQSPQLTPDGRYVAYLRGADDDRERLDLWRVDLTTGRHEAWVDGRRLADAGSGPATEAEKAERERRRQFASGITAFRFSPDGTRLLMPVNGTAFLLDLPSAEPATAGELRAVTPPGTRQTDIRFSPDGAALSYVRDGNLYHLSLATGRETPLTADGGGIVTNGIADFIAQEEMHRFDGYWWSPDGRWLAFTRVDESPVAESLRFEIEAETVTAVPQRYPYAGAANADVRLLVLELASGTMREIPYRQEQDDYLARVAWLGGRLAVQRQSRDQKCLELWLFDPVSGDGECCVRETAQTWVNLHDNLLAVGEADDAPRFLWTSERDGHSHLYLFEHGELRPLTGGEGRINRVHRADSVRALVSGWFETPTEQHLYEVRLDGASTPRRLTVEPGWHEVTVSDDGRRALDRVTSLHTPGRLELLALDEGTAAPRRVLVEHPIDDSHPYHPYLPGHVTPELGTLRAEDGQTLHYRLTRPPAPAPAGGHPAIVYVYGGPGVQRVRNEWPPLLLQLLAGQGYAVLELDNRGTGNRDRAFEAPIHRRLGQVEVRDQVTGARFLADLPWVDGARIGVFGHSYGGYMTLMCLLQRPDVFRAGVAVAPVTDWRLYDTHYTERYLETPVANPAGYRDSDVLSHLDGPARPLLLIHGMADDNVLFTHTTKLIRALQARGRKFEMMAYPGSKHALQERDVSIHRFELLLDFFGRHL
ncbi:MAG TPA: alpha/beta fold hydrolase [Pseudomonadales bacterium]